MRSRAVVVGVFDTKHLLPEAGLSSEVRAQGRADIERRTKLFMDLFKSELSSSFRAGGENLSQGFFDGALVEQASGTFRCEIGGFSDAYYLDSQIKFQNLMKYNLSQTIDRMVSKNLMTANEAKNVCIGEDTAPAKEWDPFDAEKTPNPEKGEIGFSCANPYYERYPGIKSVSAYFANNKPGTVSELSPRAKEQRIRSVGNVEFEKQAASSPAPPKNEDSSLPKPTQPTNLSYAIPKYTT